MSGTDIPKGLTPEMAREMLKPRWTDVGDSVMRDLHNPDGPRPMRWAGWTRCMRRWTPV